MPWRDAIGAGQQRTAAQIIELADSRTDGDPATERLINRVAHFEHDATVAIDGEIHEDVGYYQTVKLGSEIFFIPKLEGG